VRHEDLKERALQNAEVKAEYEALEPEFALLAVAYDRRVKDHTVRQHMTRDLITVELEVPVTCRLDSDEDVSIYEAGGVLQRFAQDFLEMSKAA
jgi:aconitase A